MRKFGIDVSTWQGDFNFEKAVAEGVQFAVLKGGGGDDGLYVDRRFADNYRKAAALDLPVGCYWFSRALTAEEARREADYFYDRCLQGRQFALPVYMDVEHKAMLALGKRKLTDVVKAWCAALEEKDMLPGIYSSKYYFDAYLYDGELMQYPHWVASWSKSCRFTPESCFGMWQFGGETNLLRSNKVAGVVCDQDYLLIDYPARIRREGKNGFATESAAQKEVCTVTLPVLRKGMQSGYVKTAQILLNAYFNAGLAVDGGFGSKTYAAVVAYQKNRGLTVDGVVGTQTWGQLLK
ncbi:MAG: hypothetical protein E7426_00190 [Ruminococcaceae bacterium]|nr:hypothetical protein [Oscillospiraceae bacterium]